MKRIENSMVAYARERKDTCPQCHGKGFIYKYDEPSGLSARQDCDFCNQTGEVTVDY